MAHVSTRDWIILSVLGLGWGSSFLCNAILVREIGPLWVSCGRVLFGALALWIVIFAIGPRPKIPWEKIMPLTVFGMLHFGLPLALYPLAQEGLASGVTGIINAMTPILVVIVSHFWPGGEHATKLKTLGVIVGFVGILILALPEISSGEASAVWAIGIALMAPLSYACALNYVRWLSGIDRLLMTTVSMTASAVLLIPLSFLVDGVPVLTSAEGWAAMLFSGVVLTGGFFAILMRLVARVGATTASTVTFIAPVSAVGLGALVLHEAILPAHMIGMGLIFLGLLIIDGRLARWLRRLSYQG
ncbi:MAG: DMT family transporter [Pseudomonadota bacterium]